MNEEFQEMRMKVKSNPPFPLPPSDGEIMLQLMLRCDFMTQQTQHNTLRTCVDTDQSWINIM